MNIIDDLIRREGSRYTNYAADRGGPTRYGITIGALQDWRGRPCTAKDVEELTEQEARSIYRYNYISRPGYNLIASPQLQALVVDCGVNHGTFRATKWLQSTVNVVRDGKFGPISAAAVNRANPRKVFARVLCTRNSFYETLDDNDPSQEKFMTGWVNRVNEFILLLAEDWK